MHRSPRQAPPPTQILCHSAATNCDASIYNSTTHLSIAEPSRLTIGSPRVASLQHISVHFRSKSEAMRSNLRGPHPQIHTCVDPATHAASTARAPHQRHDPHQQRVQNIGPRGGPQPTRHESNTQQARTYTYPVPWGEPPVTYRYTYTNDGQSAQDIVGDHKIFDCDRLICPHSDAQDVSWLRARRGSYLSPPIQMQSCAVAPF